MLVIPDFSLVRPESLRAAAEAVAEGGVPYVGGTELVAAMHLGLVAPEVLVDLKTLPELTAVAVDRSGLRLGAAVRHETVARHPDVRERWPMLATACGRLGNQRVRATGTLGGNLCFADHRSDVSTALVALEATVTLYAADGGDGRRRTLPVEDFVLGALEVDLEPGELLESVQVPATGLRQSYLRHQPAEYPTVCVALTHGPASGYRVTVGAAVERPHRFDVPSADPVALDEVLAEVLPTLEPVEDLTGSAEYKRHLVGVMVRGAVAAAADAGPGPTPEERP